MKNLANSITSLRIVFAILMLFQLPFSLPFWICYIGGGLTDLLDGFIARRLNQESQLGAKLDSIADLVFAMTILIIVVKYITFPILICVCVTIVASLRIISYMIGFIKFKTFSSLHTYANKATGFMIFAFPLLYSVLGIMIAGILVSIVAVLSSLEELMITIKSKELERDCKSILIK